MKKKLSPFLEDELIPVFDFLIYYYVFNVDKSW